MKSKKILLMILMIVTIIMTTVKPAYASDCSVDLSTDKQNYAVGQTVILTVTLSDIDSVSGIYGLQGKLTYDTDVFEKIDIHLTDDENDMLNGTSTSINGLNGWGTPTYNPDSGDITVMILGNVKTTTDIMQIELKVKEDAPLGKATIMLTDIVVTDGSDIETTPATASVNITEASEGEIPSISTTPSSEPSPSPTPSVTVTVTATPTATTTIITTPTSESSLPQTGIKGIAIPVIIGAVVISIVAFIAYRKYREF